MKIRSVLFASALAGLLLVPMARAEQISYFTGSLTTANSSEMGRASRSGVQQTWTGAETYTGQVLPSTQYFFNTYTFAASDFTGAPYVEISAYDETANGDFFVSAFANNYNPLNRGANWLGDEGASGNFQFFLGLPGVPRFFDVFLPAGDSLTLLVNSTIGGTNGLNQPFDIDVAAYADSQYGAPVAVASTPEPGTLLMTLTGLLGTVAVARRRLLARA